MVTCRNCADFTPDTIGSGWGIGACKSYDDGIQKNPSGIAIQKARLARGNAASNGLFWGSDGKRDCALFKNNKGKQL